MVKIYKKFDEFQANRLFESAKANKELVSESVEEVGDKLKISNIEIKKSVVKSYINRVKQETEKDLSMTRSLSDVAEDMVKYSLENGVTLDEVPVGMATGGDIELDSQIPDEPLEVDADAEFAGDEDVDLEDDEEAEQPELEDGDEEAPDETEGDEFEETEDEEEDEGTDEEGEDELPI